MNSWLESIQTTNVTKLGTNITSNQADVEVLAILLKDLPCTKSGFENSRGDKDWVLMQAMFLSLGPAGFSSVPYIANAKKDQSTVKKKLYEDSSPGMVTFHTFEKGKTNKDKGERIEEVEIDGEATKVSVNIGTGFTISNFLREDSFANDGKFFVDNGDENILASGTLVYLQVSSQNVEQAKKGSLLKIRKCKVASDVDTLISQQLKMYFPVSCAEYDAHRTSILNKNYATSKQMVNGTAKYALVLPKTSSYVVYDKDKDKFIIVDASEEFEETELQVKQVFEVCGTVDHNRAVKILTLALCTGSVEMLVRHNTQGNIILNGDCENLCMWLYINFRNLLSLDTLLGGIAQDQPSICTNEFMMNKKDGNFVWSTPHHDIIDGSQRKKLIFCLSSEKKYMTDKAFNNTYVKGMLTDGVSGPYYTLNVYMTPDNDFFTQKRQNGKNSNAISLLDVVLKTSLQFITLQLNCENFVEAKASAFGQMRKRKRPDFVVNEKDPRFSNYN